MACSRPALLTHYCQCAGPCVVAVQYNGEKKLFAPEEVSSMVLAKMRDTAQA